MIIVTIIVFLFFYLSCWNYSNISYKYIFIFLFLIFACYLRSIIPIELNKDYYGYFEFYNFEDSENILGFLISEPYLYLVYKFFKFFIIDHTSIINLIYLFNFILINIFFVWLARKNDLNVWKKIIFLVFYYFLFAYITLRNAPAYVLFSVFCYYAYRNKKFNTILLMPFMHLSTLPFLISIFHNKKNYTRYLFLMFLLLTPVLLFYIFPLLNSLTEFNHLTNKSNAYLVEELNAGKFHYIYLAFISIICLKLFLFDKIFHPILITTIVFYYVAFYLNPVLGFRYSPYFFMAWLTLKTRKNTNSKIIYYFNLSSFATVIFFIFTLYDTHFL